MIEPPDYIISAYKHRDFAPVVELLQSVFPCEPITESSFTRRVILDPNFNPQGAFVAHNQAGDVIGFILAMVRRRPLEDAPWDVDRGWITLFGVAEQMRNQGIGSKLLWTAEEWLRAQGRSTIWISPYAPNYWTPGVDEATCMAGLAFLQRRGYTVSYRPLSMDLSLVGWQPPDWIVAKRNEYKQAGELRQQAEIKSQGIRLEIFSPAYAGQVMDFLKQEFPGDWQRYVRDAMLNMLNGRRPCEELHLLLQGETVIGFAHCEGERFGPFGVAKVCRGKGLGALLLYDTLCEMQRRGWHNAWFLWTDDATAERLYKPAGFRETRRYAVLCKKMIL